MISKLEIHNYKSLHELTLEVGRFNVLIGENGCGKSNLLEAIALAAAAASGVLDNKSLVDRGIRVPEPKLMRSAFDDKNLSKSVKIDVTFYGIAVPQQYELSHDNQSYSKWNMVNAPLSQLAFFWQELSLLNKDLEQTSIRKKTKKWKQAYEDIPGMRKAVLNIVADRFFSGDEKRAENYFESYQLTIDNEKILQDFIIYSPENSALRFSKERQVDPLGVNGEGLLKLLRVIENNYPEQWQEIQDSLELFDWFDGIEIPDISSNDEDKVSITDRYLTQVIDQRSANEGFLFVLFYVALMVSDDTPKIFAIDNIDTSLNPKLCTRLIMELTRLAKKYDKQVFVTTHSPAILDGIDLTDDERLLVVSRNDLGHTRFKRITLENVQASSGKIELQLSTAFLRGTLGGLPKGF